MEEFLVCLAECEVRQFSDRNPAKELSSAARWHPFDEGRSHDQQIHFHVFVRMNTAEDCFSDLNLHQEFLFAFSSERGFR